MTHSTYEEPLPEAWRAQAATPYDADEQALVGGARTYPEMAAAGLWTTPTDLARYAIELARSSQGEANHVLSEEMTRQMLTPGLGDWGGGVGWGMGIGVWNGKAGTYFFHVGIDAGFEAFLVAYERRGEGAVVMTNAQGGEKLALEVTRSIAVEYGWPDYQPNVKTVAAVDAKLFAQYVGTFELEPSSDLKIALKNGLLTARATGQEESILMPESPTKFFLPDISDGVEFFRDAEGQVSYLVLHQGGLDHKALKK